MFNGGTVRYDIEVNSEGAIESLEEVQKSLLRVEEYMEGSQKSLSENSKEYIKTIEYLKSRISGLEEGTDEYNTAVQNLNQQVNYLAQSLGMTGEKAETATSSFSKLGASLASGGWKVFSGLATGATAALAGLVTKGIQATDFLETSRVSMSGLLGSVQAGNQALSEAAKFWQNNPFQRTDVTSATKQLVQYGRSVSQLSSDLEVLGNVSLSTGAGIDELALFYGRVSSSGRAMTQDIEIMSNRGIPIYRELEKQLNTTQEGVRKFASEGKINFEIFKKALEGSVSKEAMEEFENTLARQTDRFEGSISMLAEDIAGYKIVNDQLVISEQGLEKAWTRLLKTLSTGLRSEGFREGMQKIGNILAKLVDKVIPVAEKALDGLGKVLNFIGDNGEMLVPILLGVLTTVGGLASKLPGIGNLISPIVGAVSGLKTGLLELVKAHPLLAAFFAVFTAGFIDLAKNDDEFRATLGQLASSIKDLVAKAMPLMKALVQLFLDFATSELIQGGIKLLVSVLASLVDIISQIPVEAFAVFLGLIIGLKLSTISPWLALGVALAGLLEQISSLVKSAGGLKQFVDTVKNKIANVVEQFRGFGPQIVVGFLNGLKQTWEAVKTILVNYANSIPWIFRFALGIHSPSTVMYGIGENVGLGLAEGITDSSSVVQKAIDNLASDILTQAEQVIGSKSDFELIDVNGVYKEWKKVANLFTVGSEQYKKAMEKMEEARKNVNLEIIKLQKAYNQALDDSIKKIQSFFGVFEDVSTKGGKNSQQIIKNMDKQLAQTQEWAEAQKIISQSGLDPKLVEELSSMGVDSVNELSAIANMTSSELEQMNDLWLKKQALGESAAIEQLSGYKEETLNQIRELADGVEGETVGIEDVGGRLVASIGEGITGAIPTLEQAYSQLGDYIAQAQKSLGSSGGAGSVDTEAGETPEVAVKSWTEELTKSLSEAKGPILGILGGVVAGVAAFKFGPKIIQAIGGSGIGQKLSGVLGNLGGLFGKGDQLGKSMDLSGLNKSVEQVKSTGKSFEGLTNVLKVVQEGAKTIAALAVAIALVAGAMWVIDNAMKDTDFANFQFKLGVMAESVVVFGVLAYAAEKIAGLSWKGILAIIGIAADIALVGLAVGYISEKIPDDVGLVQIKLALVYEAVLAMGVLAGLGGLIAGLATLGILVIIGIAADIALVGLAIGVMAAAIPDDIELVQNKLTLLYEAVAAFEVLTGLAGVFALFEGLGILVVLGIAEDIKQVAIAIGIMAVAIPNDLKMVQTKMDYLKDAIKQMSEANLGGLLKNVIQSAKLEALLPTIRGFKEVAIALKEIAGVEDASQGIANIGKAIEQIVAASGNLKALEVAGAAIATALANGLMSQQDALVSAGQAVQGAVWQGIQGKMQDEYQQGIYLAYSFRDGLYSVVGEFERVGNEVQSKFWWGVQNKMQDEYNQGRAMGEKLRQGMYDIDYGNAGWWAVQGFIDGANNRAYGSSGVYNAGWQVADTFLKGLRDRGQQGSPWKTTMESGRFAGEGFAEGLAETHKEIVNEAEVIANSVTSAFNATDMTVSPSLSGRVSLTPSMAEQMPGYGGNGVQVNMYNTNYTQYDVEQNVRDLSYELSKV